MASRTTTTPASALGSEAAFAAVPQACLPLASGLTTVGLSDECTRAFKRRLRDASPGNPNNPAADRASKPHASLRAVVLRSGRLQCMAVQRHDVRRPAEAGGGFEERHRPPLNASVFGPGDEAAGIVHAMEDIDPGARRYNPATDVFRRSAPTHESFGSARGETGPRAAAFCARVHPGVLPRVRAGLRAGMGRPDGAAARSECPVLRPDGTVRRVVPRGGVLHDFASTRPVGVSMDVTAEREAVLPVQRDGEARPHGAPGRGTAPCISLPRYDAAARSTDGAPAQATAPGPGGGMDAGADAGETVLVVEDEPVVRMLASDVLRDLGYRVLEAPDGPAGLGLLRADGRVDLLVTDVGLPGMNGRQLAEVARRLRPGLRVLFVTGHVHGTATGGLLPPGTEVIGKPYALDALAAKVRAMLAA